MSRGLKDAQWIPVVGKNGWTLVTRDKRLRHRPLERHLMRQHAVGCFFLAYGQDLRVPDQIELVKKVFDTLLVLASTTPRPFMFGIYRDGEIRPLGFP